MAENEIVNQLNGHEFEQTPVCWEVVEDREPGLLQSLKELDTTERLTLSSIDTIRIKSLNTHTDPLSSAWCVVSGQ